MKHLLKEPNLPLAPADTCFWLTTDNSYTSSFIDVNRMRGLFITSILNSFGTSICPMRKCISVYVSMYVIVEHMSGGPRTRRGHRPVPGVLCVVQRGLDAAVRLHLLVHLRLQQRARVLIRERLALAVGALRAQVGAVRHLVLLRGRKSQSAFHPRVVLQMHTIPWGFNRANTDEHRCQS